MKVAVTDACIFIDLIELDLISFFFQLDIELHTTIEVINELFPEQKQVLKAYQNVNKLNVHTLGEKDFSKMIKIPFLRGLSQEDRSVIYIASELGNAIVLSSDKLVRDFAEKLQIEFHGLFWIFDQIVGNKLISKGQAATKLKNLLSINMMYKGPSTLKEIEKRIQSWGAD